ncbi:MAG: pyridoxal phosphate-dependent aminotransferase [Spirochaetota bacterium]|nr:pyridoxal phosphate-dependent aminotransferase [Spirochaetota bacterium]
MQIAKRMQSIDSSGIRKIFDLASKLKNPINLSIGQPDFDVPDLIKNEAILAIQNGYNRYTPTGGTPELKERLLTRLEKDKQRHFEDIIVTSGVSGALFLSFLSLIDPGDEVLIPDPYFVSYKHLVNFLGGKPVFIDTYPDFKLPKEKLENAITEKTKILILNSPSNPTGKVYSRNELIDIVDVAKKHNLLIISDEIYEQFVFNDEYTSISSLYNNVLLLSGYSKSFGIPGWRVGYAAGAKEIIKEMTVIQQYTFVCAPSFAQKAILESIDYDLTDEINNYKRKRDIVYNGLKSEFNIQLSGGAFYLFPKVPNGSDQEFVERAIANNVLVIPGSVFSERNTHFRISFANTDEQLKKGIDILNSISKA